MTMQFIILQQNAFIPEIMDKLGAKYEEVDSYESYVHETLEIVLAANNYTAINYIREAVTSPFLSRVEHVLFSIAFTSWDLLS